MAAHILGVPLDMISVKPSNNLSTPNAIVTGGSLGSEAVSYVSFFHLIFRAVFANKFFIKKATMQCCKEILKRLEPVKEKMKDAKWLQIIKAAHMQQVDLCATYM